MLDFNAFTSTLGYMGKGMVGIFAVTVVIVLSVFILNKIGAAMDTKKDNSNGQQ